MPPELVARPASLTGLQSPGVVVGLGEAYAARADRVTSAEDVLVAFGLGSCIALCLWDPAARVAGMAHVVLPGGEASPAASARFAHTALPVLLARMRAKGGAPEPRRLIARLAGGALVLALEAIRGTSRIGVANAEAVHEVLDSAGIFVAAEDLGGTLGRSVWFDPRDGGRIRVRTIGSTDRYL
jgi:chemotaxis protein CheD